MTRKHDKPSPVKLSSALRFVSLASMLTTAAAAQAQNLANRNPRSSPGEPFPGLLARIEAEKDSTARNDLIGRYVDSIKGSGRPLIMDSTVTLIYPFPEPSISRCRFAAWINSIRRIFQ